MPKGVYPRTAEHRIAIMSGMKRLAGIPRPDAVREKISRSMKKIKKMVKKRP